MDIEKILIYVVLALIYYGFKFLKKKNEANADINPKTQKQAPYFEKFKPDPNLPQPNYKPGSIQELLEEVKTQEKEQNFKKQKYSESNSLEGKGYEEEKPERLVIESVNPYTAFRTVSTEDTERQMNTRFSEFEPVIRKPHPIRNIFNQKHKLREAFVVSEILKNKEH
ncbi:MAG: hypothetical protein H7329_20195 [Opitutaceae bacterium]|nr:hypothetical protein [Cytophagales bacterium]